MNLLEYKELNRMVGGIRAMAELNSDKKYDGAVLKNNDAAFRAIRSLASGVDTLLERYYHNQPKEDK